MNHRQTKRNGGLVVVFGESDNDIRAIAHLISALRPDLDVKPLRSPAVLIHRHSADRENIKKNVAKIHAAIKAINVKSRVVATVLHKDCDDVEPAHNVLSRAIESQIGSANFICIPATPAWEIETWWYLWPDAVSSYHPTWARLRRNGSRVGLLMNAKEQLIKDLRPKDKRTRDYVESDSVGIAEAVRKGGSIFDPMAVSASFLDFSRRVSDI